MCLRHRGDRAARRRIRFPQRARPGTLAAIGRGSRDPCAQQDRAAGPSPPGWGAGGRERATEDSPVSAEWDGSSAARRGAARQTQDPVITTTSHSARSKGSFETFGLRKNLLRAISEAGFQEPRPIQAKTIPQVLKGRDVLGLAQTGTGKTAAFALPIIERLVASRGQNPRALVIAPTRELALQIHAEIELLAKYTNIRAITVFGGVGAAPQVRALASRPDIVVACPGRLLDLFRSGKARFDGIEVLVLDEADHMLDMGFLPDIKRILGLLPVPRQNLLFSATMPQEIRALTKLMLRDPHEVELGHSAPAETIEHALYPVEQPRKSALLRHILGGDDFRSAIVFLRTKHRARRLAQDLERAGHRAIALQGNMSQGQRQRAMQGFRDGRYDVLVATDIAARGIDVALVSHVINFDVPNTPDAYTHRIGRTGRAEHSGKACTFVTSEDREAVLAIERRIKQKIPRVDVRDFPGVDEVLADRAERPRRAASRAGGAQRRGNAPRKAPAKGSPTRAAARPARPGAPPVSERPAATRASFGVGVASSAKDSGLSKGAKRRKRMRAKDAKGAPGDAPRGQEAEQRGAAGRPRGGSARGRGGARRR
jgi:ATP-dependent RNA helicase RhlE